VPGGTAAQAGTRRPTVAAARLFVVTLHGIGHPGRIERQPLFTEQIQWRHVMNTGNDWSWPPEMDALLAAPQSHKILFENDDVRVLDVIIPPGEHEPEHTHRMPSVMIVDRPAMIRYYQGTALIFSSLPGASERATVGQWMEPEGPHAVENVDVIPYHAFRVELKRHQGAPEDRLLGEG
jgi:hypothetical protein